jgi:uncharacterized membrane protein YkvA (DUF1232 family)
MPRKATQTPEESAGVIIWLVQHVRLVWRLLLDERVRLAPKALVPLALAYLVMPLDIIPEVILGLGVIDDFAIVALAIRLFIALCPAACVQEHMDDIRAGRPRRSGWRGREGRTTIIDVPYEPSSRERR